MAKITTFEVGYCTHVACIAQKGSGLRICKFPNRVWLLEVGENRWIWDTGYANYFYEYTRAGIFNLYAKLTPVYLQSGESLIEQLSQHGLQPVDLQGVILSHFHGDHIAGLRDFAKNKFISSGIGWQQIRSLTGFKALKQGFVPKLIPENFEQQLSYVESFEQIELPTELAPFTTGYVLPNSQKQILLVDLSGHAIGHLGAFVLTDNGWTLLASDAAWSPANYKSLKKPSRLANLVMLDPSAYHQTLHKLQQLSQNPSIKILLSHEGDL